MWLYTVAVWLHVVAACAWVGGILFFALVLVPVLRASPGPPALEWVRAVGERFRRVGWGSLAVLLVTGPVNLACRYPLEEIGRAAFWTSPFGKILGWKLVLVALVLVVTALHDSAGVRATRSARDGSSPTETERLRALASRLGRLDAVLVLAVVYLAVALVRGLP